MTVRSSAFIVVSLWSLAAGVSVAQDRPVDNATAARIADGVEKVQAGKLLEGIEQFQRVLDTAGDELVPVDKFHYAAARWVVHGHLAELPAEGRRIYRQRIDGQAAKRLDEAKKANDEAGLNRLLADMFCSRASEEAIVELGRRAFENADFDRAEHFWNMLVPGSDGFIRYPQPTTDVATTQARLILVKLFRGERNEAIARLRELRDKFPNASGLLAGRTGKFADSLQNLLSDPASTTLPRPKGGIGWPTFAGSAARTGTTGTPLPYYWPDVAAWKVAIPLKRAEKHESPPADPAHPRALAFHPIVVNGKAYMSDGIRILAIDLLTGKLETAVWIRDGEEMTIPVRVNVRHTLTEADGVIYARMGAVAIRASSGSSALYAFAKKENSVERKQLWRLDPPNVPGVLTHFEGAPIVDRGMLYAAFWRQAGAEPVAGVACYRLEEHPKPPELLWQRIVGKAGSEPNNEPQHRHELLTLAGRQLVHCTNGGTVISLDATTGRPTWEYRYPRNERVTLPRYRDLCPPLFDGGRIYAAPADADRLLCLDAFTGRLIWEREGVEVIHLLGVARGRLIATIGGQTKGIRGLNLHTGGDSGENGWTIHDDGGEHTFGRGIVTEEAVVWPTKRGLHFLNPSDGSRLRTSIPGQFGDLCFAGDCLVVTTATEIWGYPTESKKLDNRRKDVEREPNDPAKQARFVQSLIDADRVAEAESALAKTGVDADRLRWFIAERLVRNGDMKRAASHYDGLANGQSDYAPAARVRLADLCDDEPKRRDAWINLARKGGMVRDEHGVPWEASEYAEARRPEKVERRTGLREDDASGIFGIASDSIDNRFVRSSEFRFFDPTLRVVNTVERIIPVAGRHLPLEQKKDAFWWQKLDAGPGTPGVRIHNAKLLNACADGLPADWIFADHERLPRLTRLSQPAFAEASGREASPQVGKLNPEHWLTFVYNRTVFRYASRVFVAPSNTTAGFHDIASTNGAYTLAQLTNGTMLVQRTSGTSSPKYFPCTTKLWPEPPTAADEHLFLIPDDRAVILFDAALGKVVARHELTGHDSLSGELARVRIHQKDVLLMAYRNHGVEIDRLRGDNLKRVWTRSPIFVESSLSDVAFINGRFFTAAEGTIAAFVWSTGDKAWEAPLPETPGIPWRLVSSQVGLLTYPAESQLTGPLPAAMEEIKNEGLMPGVWRILLKSYHASTTRELPVLVIDPATGKVNQRLTFPAAGPAAGVAATDYSATVVTGRGKWTLQAK